MCCICTIQIKIHVIHSICPHQLHTNSSNGFKRDQNGIIRYIFDKNMPIMFAIIYCNKFIASIYNMGHFYDIEDVINTSNLIITIFDAIDMNIRDKLLFIVTHGTGAIDICILNKKINIIFMIKDGAEFDANVNKVDHMYHTAHEINNFDCIITISNSLDIILHQTQKLITIYTMTGKGCIFNVIQDVTAQSILHVQGFILPFESNTDLGDNNLLSFYLIAIKMDHFGSIMILINGTNATNTITVRSDHTLAMDIFKLFFCHFRIICQIISMQICLDTHKDIQNGSFLSNCC